VLAKRLYHASPALSTSHRSLPGDPHPSHFSLSHGDFWDRENAFSYTMNMGIRKALKITGIVVVMAVLGLIAREYWRHLHYTDSYEECAPKFKTTEIAPGMHRCKVPFLNREFFFDERSV
jgi:hypothetical protein